MEFEKNASRKEVLMVFKISIIQNSNNCALDNNNSRKLLQYFNDIARQSPLRIASQL